MDWTFLSEGLFAIRDSEPGGAVMRGISFTSFKEYWHRIGREGEPTFDDLAALTREEAEAIYADWFFKPIHFDQLPSGVDYCISDFCVNSGVGGCLRSIQRAMGFPVTGKIDTNKQDAAFFWALRAREARDVIDAICEARLRLMMGSHKWPRFKGNWTRRLKLVKQRCYDLAKISEPAVVEVPDDD
jgi:lysozyme family protein